MSMLRPPTVWSNLRRSPLYFKKLMFYDVLLSKVVIQHKTESEKTVRSQCHKSSAQTCKIVPIIF